MNQQHPMINIEHQENNYIVNIPDLQDFIRHQTNRVIRAINMDTSVEEALIEENDMLRKKLEELLSGTKLPDEVQQKLNLVFKESKENQKKLQDLMKENQDKKESQ